MDPTMDPITTPPIQDLPLADLPLFDLPVDNTPKTPLEKLRPFAFIPLLLLQGILLHPVFRRSIIGRCVRLILTPYIAYQALAWPLRFWFEPADYMVPVNLTLNSAYACHLALLSVQWGFVKGPYWRRAPPHKKEDGKTSDGLALEASEDLYYPGILGLLSFVVSLFFNPRGIGWSYAPPASVLPRPRPESVSSYIRRHVLIIFILHFAMLVACSFTIPAYVNQEPAEAWTYFIGGEPPLWFRRIAKYVGTFFYGLAAWTGLEISSSIFNVTKALSLELARAVLPAKIAPLPFDPVSHPPLTYWPFLKTSVTDFWTNGWHSLLRRDFIICGATPGGWILGHFGRTARRIGYVLGAFILSGIMHEYTLWVSTYIDITFSTTLFFVGQGIGVALEALFTRITGVKIRGPLGWLWTAFWLIWWAEPMVTSWFSRGIQRGLVLPHEWSWLVLVAPLYQTQPVIPQLDPTPTMASADI